jgi:hypothetical protein
MMLADSKGINFISLEEVYFVPVFFFFFAVLGFELRAYSLSHCTSPFIVMGFFEIGSLELFAWAGFEPRSS